MLEIGTQAPNFILNDQNGQVHSLEDYRGKKVLLYFYPKDNTAGCTKQAIAYSELKESFNDKNVEIIGISKSRGKMRKPSN